MQEVLSWSGYGLVVPKLTLLAVSESTPDSASDLTLAPFVFGQVTDLTLAILSALTLGSESVPDQNLAVLLCPASEVELAFVVESEFSFGLQYV